MCLHGPGVCNPCSVCFLTTSFLVAEHENSAPLVSKLAMCCTSCYLSPKIHFTVMLHIFFLGFQAVSFQKASSLQFSMHPYSSSSELHTKRPNVVLEWLTLLLLIREVPGSNIGPETAYPDWGISLFSQAFQASVGILKLGHDSFLPHSFQFFIHRSPFHSTLYSLGHLSLNTLQIKTYLTMTCDDYNDRMV
jgi:hypothetical protein